MKISLLFACFTFVHTKPLDCDFIPNVWIEATTPHSVRVGWSVPTEELDYESLAYNVTITQEDEILDSEFVHHERFHTFEHLESGNNYGFKVLACDYYTRQCADCWSAEQTADTIDRDPKFVPTVMVNETSLDSITIRWSSPPPAELRDRVHQYKVIATREDPYLEEETEPFYLPGTANSYVFHNLESKHRYWIKAAACSQYKTQCGNWSTVREVWTLSQGEEMPDATWPIMTIVGVVLLVVLIIILLVLMIFWVLQRWCRWLFTKPRSVVLPTSARPYALQSDLVKMNLGDLCLELKIGDPAELLAYDGVLEFPRIRLTLGEEIGRGEFGVVRKAQARLICQSEPTTSVVVKSVGDRRNECQVIAFIRELNILANVGKHMNVVNLLGTCITNLSFANAPLIIMELCRFGNLHDYLLKHRADFISQVDTVTGDLTNADRMSCDVGSAPEASCSHSGDYVSTSMTLTPDSDSVEPSRGSNFQEDYRDEKSEPIYTEDLLCWAWQVAHGMKYLRSKAILHGDLAARNILLADNKVVKICDFGLAKILHDDPNSENQKQDFFPVSWLPIETIRDHVLSVQSDIWSYGVVLWEFFSLGEIPFDKMEPDIVYKSLNNDRRLKRPSYAPQAIYRMMLRCWNSEPSRRPSFDEIARSIGSLLKESVKTRYIKLSTMYGQRYSDDVQHGVGYLSSTKRSKETSGGTNSQVNSDASDHEESDFRTASQFEESSSSANIQLSPDTSELGQRLYLSPSQSIEAMGGGNVKPNSDAFGHGKSNYSTLSQFEEEFGHGAMNIQLKFHASVHKKSNDTSTRSSDKLDSPSKVQANTDASERGSRIYLQANQFAKVFGVTNVQVNSDDSDH